MKDCPSPNHDERNQAIDMIVLHYTGMCSADEARARLCDPEAKVSAHYMIEENGTTWRLVPEHRRAWHAGLSHWAGQEGVNGRSLGIELVNPGHAFGYRAFPEAQMQALIELLHVLKARHAVPAHRIVGHSDIAPLRKEDPGELFDWTRLADEGLAQPLPQPATLPQETETPSQDLVKDALAQLGYGYLDEDFTAVLRAFQRRFLPGQAPSGRMDAQTLHTLRSLTQLF